MAAVRTTIEKEWLATDKKYEGIATETFCGHVESRQTFTGIDALDTELTLWQINWVFPSLLGDSHVTEDGGRLWLQMFLQVVSGSFKARMGEKCALELAQIESKEKFLAATEESDPIFPTIISVKVARQVKTLQGRDNQTFLQIVGAQPQTYSDPRTASSLQLIPLLWSFTGLSSGVLPGTLDSLRTSPLYPIGVQYKQFRWHNMGTEA